MYVFFPIIIATIQKKKKKEERKLQTQKKMSIIKSPGLRCKSEMFNEFCIFEQDTCSLQPLILFVK